MRHSGRAPGEIRKVNLRPGINSFAEGSCLVSFGKTQVLCTASVEDQMPRWIRKKGLGWISGEYGMLPRSTTTRTRRESQIGRPGGRTQEIQRLIGRSLRICLDRATLGERHILVDCDVLQADGGTRTAAITGGYVALRLAIDHLLVKRKISADPMINQVAAVSCGIQGGVALLDLDYEEDSNIDTDANFVVTAPGKLVEIQATAESRPFDDAQYEAMLALARAGCNHLMELQNQAISQMRTGK